MTETKQTNMEVNSPGASENLAKQSKHVTNHRSVSCHLLSNQPRPRDQTVKSHSDVNLARLVTDKRAAKHSPIKQLQKLERQDSLASLRSLNSYLSLCDGMDVDYLVEEESLFGDEPEEGSRGVLLQVNPKLRQRQSMISGVSVNSLLTLVEEDGHVTDAAALVDNPPICITAPKDNERENQVSRNTEFPIDERKERRETARTTSDENSQTGRVSGLLVYLSSSLQEKEWMWKKTSA